MFVEHVVDGCPEISTVDFLLHNPDPGLRDFWQTLYGLDSADERLEQDVGSCGLAVQALFEREQSDTEQTHRM